MALRRPFVPYGLARGLPKASAVTEKGCARRAKGRMPRSVRPVLNEVDHSAMLLHHFLALKL